MGELDDLRNERFIRDANGQSYNYDEFIMAVGQVVSDPTDVGNLSELGVRIIDFLTNKDMQEDVGITLATVVTQPMYIAMLIGLDLLAQATHKQFKLNRTEVENFDGNEKALTSIIEASEGRLSFKE